MKKVKRWRYYCDFCKKVGGQPHSMEKHERGCTANPNRVCGLCDHCGEIQTELIVLTDFIDSHCKDLPKYDRDDDVLTVSVTAEKLDPMIKELGKLTNECPACMLAALRQAKTQTYSSFKFKERLDAWWAEENIMQQEREHRYY